MSVKAVLDFINENFYIDEITVTDFPALPYGKRIIDRNGDEMVVFYDIMTGNVKWAFPEG